MDVTDHAPFFTAAAPKTFALRGNVGAVSRSVTIFDDVEVSAELTSADLLSLKMPLFKQTDPLWKNEEYDHATEWSDRPTIQRWGCAMTSMAMILRFYNINYLPTGELITPSTLNAWLKTQPDGYFGGVINWLAVTRLTRLINAKYNTPKLEFTGYAGRSEQNIAFAQQDLELNRPSILGIPGHFFVVDGKNNKTGELTIKDPAYQFSLLSQHHEPIISVRRFTPSYTDLGYLAFSVPAGATFTLQNNAGQDIPVQEVSEYITDPTEENGAQSPHIRVLMFAKPATGDYQVHLSQSESKPYQLKIFSYDKAGNVETQDKSGTVGPEGETIAVHYEKKDHTVQQTPSSWALFRQLLRKLYRLRLIRHSIVMFYLDYLAEIADHAPAQQHSQYAGAVSQILKLYRRSFYPSAFDLLNTNLD